MFGGAYVVDNYALALKALLPRRRATSSMLLSVDYIDEGDYYQGEFYFLLLTSVLGMIVMASARDLITIFVALETISIPTFMLAGVAQARPRSRTRRAMKYYLIGVLSSAVMLYGMSLIFGVTGSTLLTDISRRTSATHGTTPLLDGRDLPLARRLRVQGQRGAVPLLGARHLRGRAHAGHRVPLGRVEGRRLRRAAQHHLLRLLRPTAARRRGGRCVWVLAALSMTLGNLVALRQTNIVRMLAYSSIAQGGFMLVPFAAAGIAGATAPRGRPLEARSSSTCSSTAR